MLSRRGSACRGRRRGGGLAETLAIERREIDRINVERRIAAAANRLGDNLAREGKQQAGAFDHDDWMHVVRGNVAQPEQARVIKLKLEQNTGAFAGRSFEQNIHLEVGFRDLTRIDIDLDRNIRRLLLRPQRAWRIRVLE